MSKKNMCRCFDNNQTVYINRQECMKIYKISCPKNTNAKCEIIPKKPKTKTFKAWARWSIDGEMFAVTGKHDDNTIPCTITIDEKWLKEGK